MAITVLTATTQAAAINYNYTTSGSTDFTGITNNTFFYDLVTRLPYFKDSSGNVQDIFFTGGTIPTGLTVNGSISATTISGGTFFGNGSGLTNVTAVSTITVGSTPITSGTNGRIPFNNSGVYGESSGLTWSNSTGRLAIGGIAPNYDFSIMRDASGQQVGMQISNNSSGVLSTDGTFIGLKSDNNTYWESLDANSLIIRSNGFNAATFGPNAVASLGRTAINASAGSLGTNSQFGVFGTLSTASLNSQFMNSSTQYIMYIDNSRKVSFGLNAAPTATIDIAAGTSAANTAPIKLRSGTNLTTPETGAIEYNGTNLFFTRSGTTRESVITVNSVNVVSPTNPNRTLTVVIDGVTYYIPAKTTND